MEKLKLVISDNKIQEIFKEEDAKKIIYKSFENLEDLYDFLKSGAINHNKDYLYGLAWDLENKIQDLAYIPKDNYQNIVEYVFDDTESLESFIDVQKLEGKEIFDDFLNEDSHSDQLDNFFSDKPCDFDHCEELRVLYDEEVHNSGGSRCPSCTKNALMQKYTYLITNKESLLEHIKQNVNTNIQTEQ